MWDRTGIKEAEERMLVQEVWQKKKVDMAGELGKEAGVQTFSLAYRTQKRGFR